MKKHPTPGAYDRARHLRRQMTDSERALWRLLRGRRIEGHYFRRQVPIGRYIADFVCHEARLIIEADGSQHDTADPAEVGRTKFLQGQGYRVLRFWNNDILKNRESVYAVIAAALERSASPSPDAAAPPPRPVPIKGEGSR